MADVYGAKVHGDGPDGLVVEPGGTLTIKSGGSLAWAGKTTYTQTYSTAAATMPAATSNTITDNSAGTPSTSAIAALSDGSTYANDVAAIRNNFATLAAELVLVKADLLAAKKVVNQLIDNLQSLGLAG